MISKHGHQPSLQPERGETTPPPAAASSTQQITYESIIFTRHLGHPLTIDNAPEHTKISLGVLADHRVYIHEQGPGRLVIADQVEYLVTGYDPADCTLTLQLIEDHRPKTEPAP